MKKVICLVISAIMLLSLLAGCSSAPKSDSVYRVAIVQQLDHASLDEIRVAIENELKARAEKDNIQIEFTVYNGQNNADTLMQIAAEIKDGGFNAIVPIATLAATCMVSGTEDSGIPIIYAAISDPEAAALTGLAHVTGTSDMLNTAFILDMMLAAQPDIQTVGLLYSESEINSEKPIAEAKAYLDAKGIAYIAKSGNNYEEITNNAMLLAESCDAVFTPTDNVVMDFENRVAEILAEAGVPHYTGADSFVACGAFATCGVNYTDLGTRTADMTVDILLGGAVPEFHVMEGGFITVNTETAQKIGLDYSVFGSMGQIIEVTTIAD